MDNWNPFGAGPMSIRKHCRKRVHPGAREALEVVLAHRLHLGRRGPHAAELRWNNTARNEQSQSGVVVQLNEDIGDLAPITRVIIRYPCPFGRHQCDVWF